jgi:hypothetical protein
MSTGFLSETERARLDRFPEDLSPADLIQYFTLTPEDRDAIPVWSAEPNRLGFALQLGALRLLGYFPDDLRTAPNPVVAFVAQQIGVSPDGLEHYGVRGQTRSDHRRQIQDHLGFRPLAIEDQPALQAWLLQRALEHDRPTFLLHLLCERLRQERTVRPGVTTLERWVNAARQQAQRETYRCVQSILDADTTTRLDALLKVDEQTGRTPLAWLRRPAATHPLTRRDGQYLAQARVLSRLWHRSVGGLGPDPQPTQGSGADRAVHHQPRATAHGAPAALSDPGGVPQSEPGGGHR